jgi:hypothetical protein
VAVLHPEARGRCNFLGGVCVVREKPLGVNTPNVHGNDEEYNDSKDDD